MKRFLIILIAADVVFTMLFLPWGMLINAIIMITASLIILPIAYYRYFIRKKA
jgi:hypothetical protein